VPLGREAALVRLIELAGEGKVSATQLGDEALWRAA